MNFVPSTLSCLVIGDFGQIGDASWQCVLRHYRAGAFILIMCTGLLLPDFVRFFLLCVGT